MQYYKERIQWIRHQLLVKTQEQVKDKKFLREPHNDRSSYVQCQSLDRTYEISALLIMLNDAKNKVRSPEKQKQHSHHTDFKWGHYKTQKQIGKFTTALESEHPYPKLYVIVDSGMTPIQKGIQGAHAVASLFKKYGILDHSALVFLESGNLRGIEVDLCVAQAKSASFREPNWKDRLTAIAIKPIELDQIPDYILGMRLASSEASKLKTGIAGLSLSVLGRLRHNIETPASG